MNNKIIGYMCQTNFHFELGEAPDGCMIYPTPEDLKRYEPCVTSCGIVKVSVTLEEVVDKGVPWRSE